MSETPLFVVVLTGDEAGFSAAPRAIGPFTDYDVAQAFTVYPSLSGSVAEAARRLHPHD